MSQGPAETRPAVAPGLHLVSVPIGNARDITLRALDVLAGADALVAEDTRSLRRLMEIHGIARAGRQVLSYHDRSGPRERARVLALLAEGRSVAYASEAGTPMVSDPGYALVVEAAADGRAVTSVPGPAAFVAALTVSGLPTDRVLFAGFPPPGRGARMSWLAGLDAARATVALYESPRRVRRTLTEAVEVFGQERRGALCRELTKLHEEVSRGTLGELAERMEGRELRGECVILIDRAAPEAAGEDDLRAALAEALGRASLKDAVAEVARTTGAPRRDVYAMALEMRDGTDDDEEAR